jgi:CubicO group peptidase (beta-lactamase class C family)
MAGQIDALFAEWDRPDSPGCSLGLGQAGRLVYGRGYGMANLQDRTPITTETIFNGGSLAKQVTGLAIELLREDGRLQLDDELRRFVPELPAYAADITLRQMLAHTSGLRDDRTLSLMAGMQDDELLSSPYLLGLSFRQQGTNFPPGQQFSYSNSNFSLLALIVRRVSGQSIEQFAGRRLFAPLQMGQTSFVTDPFLTAPGRALAYAGARQGYQLSLPNAALPGPTNLYTTAGDLMAWADNYSTARVGSREGLAATLAPARDTRGRKVAYNFGLEQRNYRDLGPTMLHDGRDGGFRSALLFWPQRRRAVAVLCNLEDIDAQGLAEQAARLWLGLPTPTPTPQPTSQPTVPAERYATLTPAELARYGGIYYDASTTHLLRFTVDGSRLRVEDWPNLELAGTAPDRFRILSAGRPTLGEAQFASDGSAVEIKGSDALDGHYRSYPDLADGAEYTGTYYSPELDATYRISLQRGVLTLDSRRFVNIALLPQDDNAPGADAPIATRFEMAEALPPITVEFTPAPEGTGASGAVARFALSLDRARHVHFDRVH